MKTPCLLLSSACLIVAARAEVVTKPVAYEHAGVKCLGYLAYDDAVTAKRPGVLVVPEWWGLNDYTKSRARQLAAMGYVAFAADMYGEGVTTTDAKKAGELAGVFYGKPVMAERARAGLDRLMQDERVDTNRVAAIGFCFGGTACQALAYSGAPVTGVVSFHGGLIPAPVGAGATVKAKFLMLNGAADPMVTAADIAGFQTAAEREKLDYQFVNYAGALHAFSNPAATELALKNGLSAAVGYRETAARRSWEQLRVFFTELFAAK